MTNRDSAEGSKRENHVRSPSISDQVAIEPAADSNLRVAGALRTLQYADESIRPTVTSVATVPQINV